MSNASTIDSYFQAKNYFPHIVWRPIGETMVEEVGRMTDGLYLSTAAALVEKESGGKNLFGCDLGSRETPPYCQQAVTELRVQRLLEHINAGGASNGVGLTQLTYPPLIREAESMGGAHLPRYQMRVGFRVLNDLIAKHGWPAGAGAYNTGSPVVNQYALDMQELEREWAERLNEWHPGMTGGLSPPGFKPLVPNPYSASYQERHPARYEWRDDVETLIRRLYRKFGGPENLHISTYHQHPGREISPNAYGRDTTSIDVWGPGGRNDPIGFELGQRVFNFIFYDPNPPYIDWVIWRRRMWTRSYWGWQPFGTDSFSFHDDHSHFTFTGPYRTLP